MHLSHVQRLTTAVIVGILMIFSLILHWMGRIPFCECGIGFWTADAWSSATSQHLADPYSFSHILHGIIFFGVLFLFRRKLSLTTRLYISLFIEIAWEILENSPIIIERYRANTASLDYFGDSILNAIGDVLFMLLGFWMTWRLRWYWTLAFLILTELILLWLIRDNLTLNVIMLLYPIDAIREWQIAH
jgi:hypothetical protein